MKKHILLCNTSIGAFSVLHSLYHMVAVKYCNDRLSHQCKNTINKPMHICFRRQFRTVWCLYVYFMQLYVKVNVIYPTYSISMYQDPMKLWKYLSLQKIGWMLRKAPFDSAVFYFSCRARPARSGDRGSCGDPCWWTYSGPSAGPSAHSHRRWGPGAEAGTATLPVRSPAPLSLCQKGHSKCGDFSSFDKVSLLLKFQLANTDSSASCYSWQWMMALLPRYQCTESSECPVTVPLHKTISAKGKESFSHHVPLSDWILIYLVLINKTKTIETPIMLSHKSVSFTSIDQEHFPLRHFFFIYFT